MSQKKKDEYDIAKGMLNTMRTLNESKKRKEPLRSKLITEAQENPQDDEADAIAITNDPRFGQNVLKNQIDAFRQAVNPGARFADENGDDAKANPLVFFPNTGNLVFSGSIPSMGNLKFQFSLNDVTSAPYIFVDGLAVTEQVVQTLNKLHGYYLNWRDSFLAAGDLLGRLQKKKED